MKAAALSTAALLLLPSVAALNGNGMQAFATYDGWKAFEVVTQGDSIDGYKAPGQFDGIGAYLMEGGEYIRLLLNHETPFDCDQKSDASVSEIILHKPSFLSAIKNMITTGSTKGEEFVYSMGLAYDTYRTKDGESVKKFDGNKFKWFCSGKVHKANAFGNRTGFVDQMYIFGEEAPSTDGWGRFFALHEKTLHMISGSGSGDATVLQGGMNGLPPDALENMAMIDTGEKEHVVLLYSPDYGSKRLKMYVGRKGFRTDGQSCGSCDDDADFLARNGLAFGSSFYLQASLPMKGGTVAGTFGTDFKSAITGEKLEDIATSPLSPTKVVLAEQLSGVYMLEFNISFTDGVFSASDSSFTIGKMNVMVSNPDNVEWSADDSIFTVSDDFSGAITRLRTQNDIRVIASNQYIGEASGLVDISELLDFAPSSILLVNSMRCPTSMSVLVNPEAQLVTLEPTAATTTAQPTNRPTSEPSNSPTNKPSSKPTSKPTNKPTEKTNEPTSKPTIKPTLSPITTPNPSTSLPSKAPATSPSDPPSNKPTTKPTAKPVTSKPAQLPLTKSPSGSSTALTPNSCGNGSCELNETAAICSQDCESILLSASDTGINGAAGVIFYLRALRDVNITSLNLYTGKAQTDVIEVYARDGMYQGHELDEDGWSLVYTENITQLGRNESTGLGSFDPEVNIEAGSIKSFYIYAGEGNHIMYEKGNEDGHVFSSDLALEFYEGVGVTSKFSGTYEDNVYPSRVFKGEIVYDIISPNSVSPSNVTTKMPGPTKKPTASPTKRPISKPSPFPTTLNPTTASPMQASSCGNGSCESEETATTCSQDCNGVLITTNCQTLCYVLNLVPIFMCFIML